MAALYESLKSVKQHHETLKQLWNITQGSNSQKMQRNDYLYYVAIYYNQNLKH